MPLQQLDRGSSQRQGWLLLSCCPRQLQGKRRRRGKQPLGRPCRMAEPWGTRGEEQMLQLMSMVVQLPAAAPRLLKNLVWMMESLVEVTKRPPTEQLRTERQLPRQEQKIPQQQRQIITRICCLPRCFEVRCCLRELLEVWHLLRKKVPARRRPPRQALHYQDAADPALCRRRFRSDNADRQLREAEGSAARK